jgi:hypothetical protein
VPSSLDKVETAILAASLETIDRVGPCSAKIEVTNVFLVESNEIANGFSFSHISLINENEGFETLVTKGSDGKGKLYTKDLATNTVTTLDITCHDVCLPVVAIGCSVGSVVLCAAVCGPAAPACALICASIYALMCLYAQGTDCDYLCSLV